MPKAHSSPRIPSGPAGNGWDTNLVLPFASLCPCSLASLSSSAVRTLEVLLFSNEKMQRMNFSRNFQISRLSMQKNRPATIATISEHLAFARLLV